VTGKAPPLRLIPAIDAVRRDVSFDPWLKLDAVASYLSISRRRLQDLLRAHPMPTFRPGGRGPFLVRLSDVDAWMHQWRVVDVEVDDADVAAFVRGLRAPRGEGAHGETTS